MRIFLLTPMSNSTVPIKLESGNYEFPIFFPKIKMHNSSDWNQIPTNYKPVYS